MPIYAYRCETCGHAKDVLQKMSDPVLTTCPACGAETFRKQLTAAGFQLKGSGWYATDFRGGDAAKGKPAGDEEGAAAPAAEPGAAAGKESKESGKESGKDSTGGDKPAAAPAPAPAASSAAPKASAAPSPTAPPSTS